MYGKTNKFTVLLSSFDLNVYSLGFPELTQRLACGQNVSVLSGHTLRFHRGS